MSVRTLQAVVGLALAIAAAVPPSPASGGTGAVVGYRIEYGEVVFVFDPAEFEFLSHDRSGEMVPRASLAIERVAIAGDFNQWSRTAWVMSAGDSAPVEMRRPIKQFLDRPEWQFKFLVNGAYWAEPPSEALNRVPTGFRNRSFNLALRPREQAPAVLGYRLDGETVVFEFDPRRFEWSTRDDTGIAFRIDRLKISDVHVAGEFNQWSRRGWRMSRTEDGRYLLERPREAFAGRATWQFKFVINGMFWVEPPSHATNRIPTGVVKPHDHFNLTLTP